MARTSFLEPRPTTLKMGVIRNATGSAYIEAGNTRIYVAIYGPLDDIKADPRRLSIEVEYELVNFSNINPRRNRRSSELSLKIQEALERMVLVRAYPGKTLRAQVVVVNADGGTRTASLTALTCALLNSGLEVRNECFALSIARMGEQFVLDPDYSEDSTSQADFSMGFCPGNDRVNLLQSDGTIPIRKIDGLFSTLFPGIFYNYLKTVAAKYQFVGASAEEIMGAVETASYNEFFKFKISFEESKAILARVLLEI